MVLGRQRNIQWQLWSQRFTEIPAWTLNPRANAPYKIKTDLRTLLADLQP